MSYKTIPKRFTIEMVHCVIILINSLPHNGGLYSVLSPRETVTKMFRCPNICIKQYLLEVDINDIEQERSINTLYYINIVGIIPTPPTIVKRVNYMGMLEIYPMVSNLQI